MLVVVTQFSSKETISSRRPRRWGTPSSPSRLHTFLYFPSLTLPRVPQFPQHCLTSGGLAGRTIHWLAMPVICISYFQIPRSPGNSHPSTAPPTHHKYLPIQLDFAAQFSPPQIQIQKKVHERQNQVQVVLQ